MKPSLLACAMLLSSCICTAQSAEIWIDEQFDDWAVSTPKVEDYGDSQGNIDLEELQVTNDGDFLYFRLQMNVEVDLFDQYEPHDVMIYIDTDNDDQTGTFIEPGFGSDIDINCDAHTGWFHIDDDSELVDFTDLVFHVAPSLEADHFEFGIGLNASPGGIPLFQGDVIRIMIRDELGGDRIPNEGVFLEHTIDPTPVPEFVPISIERECASCIRILAYNTLYGLTDSPRQSNFERIVKALDPDIIGFSEATFSSEEEVKELMDEWIPLGTPEGWYTIHDNGELVSASKWPIIDDWDLTLQHALLIDLPEIYATDILFINSHLSCCGSDDSRQFQVDQFANFILDAKSPGGMITLEENTPFVYAGDLNLVGKNEQLHTLLTGEIVNVDDYGIGGPLDWDESDITDLICMQTENRMCHTWRKTNFAEYPPSRLDFHIYSDAVLTAEKAFTLQTEVMPQSTLDQYNLESYDTELASDHLPVTADYMFDGMTGVAEVEQANIKAYPNPGDGRFRLSTSLDELVNVQVVDISGKLVWSSSIVLRNNTEIDLSHLGTGIYYLRLTGDEVYSSIILSITN